MKLIHSLLLASALLVVGGLSHAQAQSGPVCILLCFPPDKFDGKRCTCTTAGAKPAPPACGLVCPIDTTLDAKRCRCVNSRGGLSVR